MIKLVVDPTPVFSPVHKDEDYSISIPNVHIAKINFVT